MSLKSEKEMRKICTENWKINDYNFLNLVKDINLEFRITAAAAAAKSLQSCPTLCDPIDGSPPGSPVPGILQARTLEWVAISFSSAWKWKVKVKSLSCVWLLATPWTAAHQAPPFMGFSTKNHSSPVLLGWPKSSFRMTELFHQPDRINSRKIIFRHKIINQVGFILRSNASSTSKKF